MVKKRFPMIWNKPGGQGGKDPWRRKDQEGGPPDLDQVFKLFAKKIKEIFGKKGGHGGEGEEFQVFGGVVFVVVAALYLVSGFYTVEPAERAVVLRFGKYVRTEEPGWHWLPPLIESKALVNVDSVSTSDHSGLMLTQDGNIVSVGVSVQYRIGSNPLDVQEYLFNVVNPVRSLNQSAESALRQVIGKSTMDDILTLRRAEIANSVKEQTVDTLNNYKTGLSVLEVVMQFAKAPAEVQPAFDEVIKASADKERLINQAKGYENEVLPRAKGVSERLRNEALGYKQETILVAEGNVKRFNLVLPQYVKAPKVTKTRMFLDTIEHVLTKTSKIIVDAGEGNNLIYLPLDRLIPESSVGKTETGKMAKEHLPLASRLHKEKK